MIDGQHDVPIDLFCDTHQKRHAIGPLITLVKAVGRTAPGTQRMGTTGGALHRSNVTYSKPCRIVSVSSATGNVTSNKGGASPTAMGS